MIQTANSPLEKIPGLKSPTLLLTPRQAAASLQISERQLWRLEKAGEIKSARIGKRIVRFSPDALRNFIDGLAAAAEQGGNGDAK
jgi:excisionase family DNA binding protein